MSSSPAVLVIGPSGAIGSALINDLGPDHQVGGLRLVAATQKEEAARSLRERGIEMRHLDPEIAETGGLDAIQPASTGCSSSAATTYACSSSPRRPSTRRMGRSLPSGSPRRLRGREHHLQSQLAPAHRGASGAVRAWLHARTVDRAHAGSAAQRGGTRRPDLLLAHRQRLADRSGRCLRHHREGTRTASHVTAPVPGSAP